ncbi:hypothetical protein [Microcoleus sp. bin38.metabat.b11b12b14.051]|nr:hypothetical protein [Microcoleus sp. bin38.metabat.b11b12b14.051]
MSSTREYCIAKKKEEGRRKKEEGRQKKIYTASLRAIHILC